MSYEPRCNNLKNIYYNPLLFKNSPEWSGVIAFEVKFYELVQSSESLNFFHKI